MNNLILLAQHQGRCEEAGSLHRDAISVMLSLAAKVVVKQIPLVRNLGREMLIYDVSFIAFMLANVITFAVASQLFGDLFILIVTGTVAGFVIRIHNAAVDSQSSAH